MTYTYAPNNPGRFATNLLADRQKNRLTWDSSGGQEALILQTPFGFNGGSSASELCGMDGSIIECVCQKLGSMTPEDGAYTEVFPGVWARFVTPVEKVRFGCPMHGAACSYSVYACDRLGEECLVYAPRDGVMISPFCDVPLEIHIEAEPDAVRRGFGPFSRTVATGFYKIRFPANLVDGFAEGTLWMNVDGTELPVTREMAETGTVYVRTNSRPTFRSDNRGHRLC